MDFCFTQPGEILTTGSKCGSDGQGYPEASCGCHRAMAGTTSLKSTTVGVVASCTLAYLKAAADIEATGFFGGKSSAEQHSQHSQATLENLKLVSKMLVGLKVGQRVGFKFFKKGDGVEFFIFKCGEEKRYGV